MDNGKIVYCHCTYARIIDKDTKKTVLTALTETGVPFVAVPDLCEMAAHKDPQFKNLLEGGPVRIAACYKRAVKGLCSAAGVEWHDEDVDVINMREGDAAAVVQALLNTEAQS